MLVARKLVDSDIVPHLQIAPAKRIGRVASPRGFPVFDVAHRMNDLGAGAALCTAVKNPARVTSEGIERGLISQGRVRTGILHLGVLRPGQPAWLRKADIHVIPHRADMRLHPLEDLLTALVLIEAELEVGAEQSTALRDAVEQRM